MLNLFIQTIKSISGRFGFDPLTNSPTFNLELTDIQHPEYTLKEIFEYLEQADKPCIVAIDEFQQIAKYPEKNIEATLRSHIQRMGNCNFVFAGSERHILQEMFVSSARPFYHSADILELNAIAEPVYTDFVVGLFRAYGKQIAPENVEYVYRMFKGHTYYIQKTFNGAFADTPVGADCELATIEAAVTDMVAANDTIFREILSNIPEKQKDLLYAIALEGEVSGITSSAFVRRHGLSSASSVQAATKKLLERDLITELNKKYALTDKLFGMWIRSVYGKGAICG
jgi:hypothetical protein